MCALANHGGGYIVFGFNDADLSPMDLGSDVASEYGRDLISSAVATYLDPPPMCNAVMVTSSAGRQHPVVRVPSHTTVPVHAKANGPNGPNGRPQGIEQGRVYVRQLGTSGPESAPITTSAQWPALIRRCVLADRDGLVGMFGRLLDPTPTPPAVDGLKLWHENTAAAYARIVEREQLTWSTSLLANYAQYSYELVLDPMERMPEGEMLEALRQINARVRDLVWRGWSMFYPFQREGIAPYFVSEAAPEDVAVLEAQLLGGRRLTDTSADFWRVSNDGKASIVRPYREDRASFPLGPGRTLGPEHIAGDLTEIVRHAHEAAVLYRSVRSVRFRCEWRGLTGRTFDDESVTYGGSSRSDRVIATGDFPIASLASDWPVVVSRLITRLSRSFDSRLELEPRWVQMVMPRFRIPGLD